MRQLLVLAILLLSTATSNAAVGRVTEQTGPTEIKRKSNVLPSELETAVEMDDTITTANAVAGITFEDNTKVHITEQSKLVIDNFVYEPKKNTGKLAIKIALGTVKYTSGQIAKHDPQKVVVETPTATIGVRGTDFSSTVDEIGRSQIILLPSCPPGWKDVERDCKTGKIVVMTDGGEVWLTKPFEGTRVTSRFGAPSKPVILELSLNQINNLLIVSPPAGLKEPELDTAGIAKGFLDEDLLGEDFLAYDELNQDQLQFSRLDINALDNFFLDNLLDINSSMLLGNELKEFDSLLPDYNEKTGLKFFLEEPNVVLYRETVNHYAELSMPQTSSATLNLTQDTVTISQIVNRPGTTIITITQTQ